MCDHDNRTFPLVQILFQPDCHLIVNMVRRLVKNQHICRIDKCPCKCYALFLASGQMINLFVMICNPEAVQRILCFTLSSPVCSIGTVCHIGKNCCMLRELRRLRKIGDTKSLLKNHLSLIRLFQPCNYFQKCCLASSIDSDNSNFISLMNPTGNIIKHLLLSKHFTDMLYINYVHLQFSSSLSSFPLYRFQWIFSRQTGEEFQKFFFPLYIILLATSGNPPRYVSGYTGAYPARSRSSCGVSPYIHAAMPRRSPNFYPISPA